MQIAGLHENREAVWTAVKALPGAVRTRGAFYFFVRLPAPLLLKHTDVDVVKWLSQRHKVWLLPGSGFGCPGHLRVSYGNLPTEKCAAAAARLSQALHELLAGASLD